MSFLKNIGQTFSSINLDSHGLLDEKRILGALYLIATLVSIFVLAIDPSNLAILLLTGLALYLGIPIGDALAPIPGLQSLGVLDLITNKANRGDPSRLFGVIFLISGLVYTFEPLWNPGILIKWQYLGLICVTGVSLLGVALVSDKNAIQSNQPGNPTPQGL